MFRRELELFKRYEGNPILTPAHWPYKVNAAFNPGAAKIGDEVLLLVRVEDMQGYSHLTVAKSKDGRTNWQIDTKPTLKAKKSLNEDIMGLEDPRIVWLDKIQKYVITCTTFFAKAIGSPPTVSFITTKDFRTFDRLGPLLMPENKDAALFSQSFNGRYALINRPIIGGKADIWISFSPDLKHWGEHRVLIPVRPRSWDSHKVGLGPPPIKTREGWLIIYHGVRVTASGALYRIGLALLDLDNPLKVIRRSREWVFGPKENYEKMGDVANVTFPCGVILNQEMDELLIYYGAADTVVGLAIANIKDIIDYLKCCPEY